MLQNEWKRKKNNNNITIEQTMVNYFGLAFNYLDEH